MIAFVERLTGVEWNRQGTIALVSLGHGGTHWIQAAVFILLPFIADALGLSYTQTALVVSIFHLSLGAGNITAGALVDMSGRRAAMMVGGLALGGVLFALVAAVPSYAILVLSLIAVAVSLTLWHPAAIPFLAERHPKARGYVLAVHSLGASLGDALAPLTAGALLTVLGWRETTVLTALPAVLIAALVAFAVRRDPGGGVQKGVRLREYVAGFGELLRRRRLLVLCLMSGMRTTVMIVLYTFIPLYSKDVLLLTPFWMGATMMLFQTGGFIATPGVSLLSDRIGCRPVFSGALVFVIGLLLAFPHMQGLPTVLATATVLGAALFSVRPVGQSWMMGLVPRHLGGTGTSLMFAVQAALSAVGTAVAGAIADHWGLATVFTFAAVLTGISALLALFVPEPERA